MKSWHRAVKSILLLALCLLLAPQARGLSDDWSHLSRQAAICFNHTDYAQAASLYHRAYTSGENEKLEPEQLIDTLINMSECLTHIRSYIDAQATLNQAGRKIVAAQLGTAPIAIRFFRRLSRLEQARGRWTEAIAAQSQVVDLAMSIFGTSSSIAIPELEQLQIMQLEAAHYSQSIDTGVRVLEALKSRRVKPQKPIWGAVNQRIVDALQASNQSPDLAMQKDSFKAARDYFVEAFNQGLPTNSPGQAGQAAIALLQLSATEHNFEEVRRWADQVLKFETLIDAQTDDRFKTWCPLAHLYLSDLDAMSGKLKNAKIQSQTAFNQACRYKNSQMQLAAADKLYRLAKLEHNQVEESRWAQEILKIVTKPSSNDSLIQYPDADFKLACASMRKGDYSAHVERLLKKALVSSEQELKKVHNVDSSVRLSLICEDLTKFYVKKGKLSNAHQTLDWYFPTGQCRTIYDLSPSITADQILTTAFELDGDIESAVKQNEHLRKECKAQPQVKGIEEWFNYADLTQARLLSEKKPQSATPKR